MGEVCSVSVPVEAHVLRSARLGSQHLFIFICKESFKILQCKGTSAISEDERD